MQISLIVALSENYCIGIDNRLPWKQSADLRHFKTLTLSKPVIMGRKTFESIGRILSNRPNVIISRNQDYRVEQADVEHSLEAALSLYQDHGEVMIIGGAQLFEQALPLADRLYLTWIHTQIDGDVFFPHWPDSEWQEVSREKHLADEKNEFDYSFVTLERVF